MFFFYSIWGFLFLILSYTHLFIENKFLIKNNPFLIRKRTFKYISYFEKIILVFFYKKGWFENSLANLYRIKDITDYRKMYYPTIQSFHTNYNKIDYCLDNLRFFSKQFRYYNKNKINKKFIKILKLCFSVNNKNFVKFLMLQILYFNKYFNFNSYQFFNNKSEKNLIKFNRVFYIFLQKSRKKMMLFNLDKWYDWYSFNFNKNFFEYCNSKILLNSQQKRAINDFKNKKISKWIQVVFKYKKRIVTINNFFNKKFKGIIYFKLNPNTFFKIRVNTDFYKLLKYYIIKFSESSITKHINSNSLKNFNIQYLRKNRIFNKGRYSRNRQLYRTGVYWCLWLNIIMVYGLYFMFYRFTFNFGYFWWGILVLAYSTIFSRISKYNFFNLNYVIKEFHNLIKWYGILFYSLFTYIENILYKIFLDMNLYNYIAKYKNDNFSIFYNNYYYYFIKFFKKIINKRKRMKIVYFWQGMKERDNSFLRYKTVLHWIKEIYRLIIT